MKRLLTTEQTISLIQLGVDPSNAFTLDDMLEVLPKEIDRYSDDPDDAAYLAISVRNDCASAWYKSGDYTVRNSHHIEDELIDALYGLACWYYGEYLKQDADKT